MNMKFIAVIGLLSCFGCSSANGPAPSAVVPSAVAPSAVAPSTVVPSTVATSATEQVQPAHPPVRRSIAKVAVGDVQPLQVLTDIRGRSINLQQADQRKLIIFFATWCSDSKRLMQQLQQSPLLEDPKLLIVAIGREETSDALQDFSAKYRFNFPFVADAERKLYSQFTDQGIPRVVLVNEQNIVVKTFLGEIPRAIDEIVWP